MRFTKYFSGNSLRKYRQIHPLSTSTKRTCLMETVRNTNSSHHGDTVLVTGGAGFLGQHIISLLQTRAPHVKQIKVLDLQHYENKLGHEAIKPVVSIIGSIEDPKILYESFAGVNSVYHVAGLISYGTFPDYAGMHRVNVEGTRNVIQACMECGVQRLVFCSTVDVVVGHDDIVNGDEVSTTVPKTFLFPGYPESKYQAERMVLQANGIQCGNGSCLQTISLRANVMYGECDPYYITNGLRSARNSGNTLYRVGDGSALFQPVYVGNTAWAFICADKALRHDPTASGQFYFIPDDTPLQNTFTFMQPFLEVKGYRLSRFKLPFRLIYNMLLLAELLVKGLSPLITIKLPAESYSVKYIYMTLCFKNDKAKRELGFKPIFSPEEAKKKSLQYYRALEL